MSKLDELKDKFQDLLSKTPFGRKDDDDDDEYDKTGEFTSSDLKELDDDGSTQLTSISLEDDDDDKELKQKLNKQMIIRVVLVLVIVGLAADHFLNSDSGSSNNADDILANLPDTKKKPKRKRRRKPKKAEAEKVAEKPTTETKEKTNNMPDTSLETTVVNSDDLSKGMENIKKGQLGSVPSDPPDGSSSDALNLDSTQANNEMKKEEDASGIPPETSSEVLDISKMEKDLSEPMGDTSEKSMATDLNKMGQNSKVDEKKIQKDIAENSKSLEDKMLDSIKEAKKKEYVPPPNYEDLGRGLVYNCTDKYWSCVDKKSFFKCRDNHAWIKANNKTTECAIKNVYANVKDCQKVQQYYIDNLMTMDACN